MQQRSALSHVLMPCDQVPHQSEQCVRQLITSSTTWAQGETQHTFNTLKVRQ
jgi:hypothetical protein